MIDFAASRTDVPPETRNELMLFAAVVAQAVYDASTKIKEPGKRPNVWKLRESAVKDALRFLFAPGCLEPFAATIGFNADRFRRCLVSGQDLKGVNKDRIYIRARKYGYLP